MKRIMCVVCVVLSMLCWVGCRDDNQALHDYSNQQYEQAKSNLDLSEDAQKKTDEFQDLLDQYKGGSSSSYGNSDQEYKSDLDLIEDAKKKTSDFLDLLDKYKNGG